MKNYLDLVKNTTKLKNDIGYSEYGKQMPKQFALLRTLGKTAFICFETTGSTWESDSVLSFTGFKADLNTSPLTWNKSAFKTYYADPLTQHNDWNTTGLKPADCIPPINLGYMNLDATEFNNRCIPYKEFKDKIKDYLADCHYVVLYRNTEKQTLLHLFGKKVKKPTKRRTKDGKMYKIVTENTLKQNCEFSLQGFYKDLDQGLIGWQYGLNSLMYRLNMHYRPITDNEKVYAYALATYKFKQLYKNLNLNQITDLAKQYDKTRPLVKATEGVGNDDMNGLRILLKVRPKNTMFQVELTKPLDPYADNKVRWMIADSNGEMYQLSEDGMNKTIRAVSIKLHTQSLNRFLSTSLPF